MKRFILFVLTLTLLVSCSHTDMKETVLTDTLSVQTENETVFMIETAEDTASVSSVPVLPSAPRFEKQYQVTALAESIVGLGNFYQFQDKLYHIAWNEDEAERRICLTSWNSDSTENETRFYREPEVGMTAVPEYIFPLTDGKTLMMYNMIPENGWIEDATAIFTLLADDDSILLREEIHELQYMLGDHNSVPHVFENGDGTFEIVFTHAKQFYVFDEMLTLKGSVNADATYMINRQDDGCYRIGITLSSQSIIDMQTQEITSAHYERVPASMTSNRVYGSYTDSMYICTTTDIFRLTADRQPQRILEWADTPFSYTKLLENVDDSLWILDESNLFIQSTVRENGTTVSELFHIAVTEVPASEKTVIDLAVIASPRENQWLNDMVYQFNQSSAEYKIDMTHYPISSREEGRLQANELLLSAYKPDILFSGNGEIFSQHNGKIAYLDLSETVDQKIFGCMENIHVYNGALYQLPLSMTASLFVSSNAVLDSTLTWNKLEQLIQILGDGETLTSVSNYAKTYMYSNTPMQFIDRRNNSSSFDSDEFCRAIRLLDEMNTYVDETAGQLTNSFLLTHGQYGITNGTLHRRLSDGGIKLIAYHFNSMESYAALKLLFHDIPFTFCGLPTVSGQPCADIQTQSLVSVSADTDCQEGCLAFISQLISDKAQTHKELTKQFLPVTASAMQCLLDESRYQYYIPNNMINQLVETPDTDIFYLAWSHASSKTNLDFGTSDYVIDDLYTITRFTEEDDRRIIDFFDNCTSYRTDDETVMKIVNEELSYWKNDARSLEDTGNIINSRVWIYLNE